jgi:hypothetical protein
MMRYTFLYGDDIVPTFDIANRLADKWQERVTEAPKFIDTDHAYIHEGIAYQASVLREQVASTGQYVFRTPSTTYIHYRPAFVSIAKGNVICELWETTTPSTSVGSTWGTVTPYNRKRTSAHTANTLVYSESTSAGGVKIDAWRLWGSTGAGGTGGGAQVGQPHEWVLKQNTQYRLAFDTTEAFSANLFWYEEANA